MHPHEYANFWSIQNSDEYQAVIVIRNTQTDELTRFEERKHKILQMKATIIAATKKLRHCKLTTQLTVAIRLNELSNLS